MSEAAGPSMDRSRSKVVKDSKKRKRPNGALNGLPKGRMDRTISTVSLSDDPSTFGSLLSPEVKELLIKFKKSHARKDPFSKDNQGIIDEFLRVTNTVHKQVLEGNLGQINLTEAALLLDCSMRTFSKQVQHTKAFVHQLAEFATSTGKSKSKASEEPDKEDELPEPENPPEDTDNGPDNIPAADSGQDDTSTPGSNQVPSNEEKESATSAEATDAEANAEVETEATASEKSTDPETTSQPEIPDPESTPVAQAETDDVTIVDDVPALAVEEAQAETSENTETNEEGGTMEKDKPEERPRAKRVKRDFGDPPILIPWYEQVITFRSGESDDENPPILVSELRKKRVVKEKTAEEIAEKLAEKAKRESMSKEQAEEKSSSSDVAVSPVEPLTQLPPVIPTDGVVIKVEKLDEDDGTIVPIGVCLPDFLLSKNELNRDMAGFSPEEQMEIQKFINQLHYLPFTCELTKEEVETTFQHAVDRLEQIYKEHNIPYSRHVAKVASDACAQISSNYAKWLDLDKSSLASSSELHETFSQSRRSIDDASPDGSQDDDDSELTIMERTVEKTKDQSETRMKEMMHEIHKSIVPKYAQIPLIEENTEGFFRRVKSFELRMKKVLADEENKEEFDVRKYEMDVLDVTNMESQELTEETRISSPGVNLPSSELGMDYNILGFPFDGLPSPSSSDGGDGVKWIPLRQIFSHMKKLDRHEAARMFYAVLALLSFQNLDVKYDNHYSAESAALTAHSLDHSQDNKYPRGVKIMTSRCPDVDKEEVYIAALSNKSRTETFRELEALHREQDALAAKQHLGGGEHPRLNGLRLDEVVNGDLTRDINDTFIHGECSEYQGVIFRPPRVRKRKRNSSSSSKHGPSSSTSTSTKSPTKPSKSSDKASTSTSQSSMSPLMET